MIDIGAYAPDRELVAESYPTAVSVLAAAPPVILLVIALFSTASAMLLVYADVAFADIAAHTADVYGTAVDADFVLSTTSSSSSCCTDK